MNDWLAERARISPQQPALVFEDETWTYAALNARVSRMCGALAGQGVARGALVAAHLPNNPAFVTLVHALARLGAVIVPLNRRLTVPELAYQLEAAGVTWLIHGDETQPAGSALPPEVRALPVALLDSPAGGADPAWEARPVDLSASWGVLFTSGTTGKPKGAALIYGNLLHSAQASAARLGALPGDRWLLCLPLYHIGGLSILFRACLDGAGVHLLENFAVDAVNAALDGGLVTLVSLVPTMLLRIMEARGWRAFPAAVRLALLGGAAAPADLLARCVAAGVPVAVTYGLTEAASQVATATAEETRRKPGSAGKPLNGILLRIARIRETNEAEISAGEVGEIWLAGPTVMAGYLEDLSLRDSAGSEAVFARGAGIASVASLPRNDMWLATGDLGYLDADGDLWVVQRRADLIVTGGENVYPAEVEAALRTHPAVREVCVVGLPDEAWGQVVAAVVVIGDRECGMENGEWRMENSALPEDQLRITSNDLSNFLRERLAGYKIPRVWRFVDALPQTESGKVKRGEVRALFEVKNG
jgi:O-succinylbenzoic acid--CoA ligase